MLEISLLSLFLTGLLGGVHCLGMCGGIVTAISLTGTGNRPLLLLGYNLGRLGSYTLIGALLGGLSQWGLAQTSYLPLQQWQFALANLLLILLGLYLAGLSTMVGRIEKLGVPLWQRLQPLTRRFLPVRHPWHSVLSVPSGAGCRAAWCTRPAWPPWPRNLRRRRAGHAQLWPGHPAHLLLMGSFASQLQASNKNGQVRLFAGLAICGAWCLAPVLAAYFIVASIALTLLRNSCR